MTHALVATSSYLLRVNLSTKEVVPLEAGRQEYYGVSWFAGDTDLTLSHSGLDNRILTDLGSYAQSEIGWISSGERESRRFLSQPHQIICAPDGRVVCANTGRNVVTVIDLAKPGLYHEAGIGPARWDRLSPEGETGDHINSVFIKDQQLFVIAHRFDKGSQLACFSYPELELLYVRPCKQKTGLHNIWITGEGQQISCHSEAGTLVDLAEDIELWSSGSAIYTRGLAASAEYVVLGESQRSGRDLRRSSISGLWILDRKTWKALDYICLGPYGVVNEVRLLDVPDEAHHGKVFKGLHRLLERDLREDARSSRITAAKAVLSAREVWSDYDLAMGAPQSLPGGAHRADADTLCLAIRKTNLRNGGLNFEYTLAADDGAGHVSAVLDYRGFGGDTDMTALLLQPADGVGRLSVWRQNGQAWSLVDGIGASALPLSSSFRVTMTDDELVVVVGDTEFLRIPREAIGLDNPDARVGIRWLGATVRPIN